MGNSLLINEWLKSYTNEQTFDEVLNILIIFCIYSNLIKTICLGLLNFGGNFSRILIRFRGLSAFSECLRYEHKVFAKLQKRKLWLTFPIFLIWFVTNRRTPQKYTYFMKVPFVQKIFREVLDDHIWLIFI